MLLLNRQNNKVTQSVRLYNRKHIPSTGIYPRFSTQSLIISFLVNYFAPAKLGCGNISTTFAVPKKWGN